MVQRGIKNNDCGKFERGKQKRKKDCSRGKRAEQKKKRKMVKSLKGRRKEEERKKERKRKKTVQWFEIKKQKRDALERTSLNGYDE